MKLYHSPTSPYVRKVNITALEAGIHEQIEHIPTFSFGTLTEVADYYPLGKIPVLVLDNGTVLYDSRVICEYIDDITGVGIFPKDPPYRWEVLRLQALADGALDAGILSFTEECRPESEQSRDWIVHQNFTWSQAMDAMDVAVDKLGECLTIAHITFCVALGYFDFRFTNYNWRETRPGLADWYTTFSGRPSALATEPQDLIKS